MMALPAETAQQRARRLAWKRAYRLGHREEIRAKQRAYDAAHSAEKKRLGHSEDAAQRAARLAKRRAYEATKRDEKLDKNRVRNRAYYVAHREELLAKYRAYRTANLDKRLAKDRAYRAAHREALREKRRAYLKARPEVESTRQRRRRAAQRNAPRNDLTHLQWLEIQAAQSHRCWYCGKRQKGKLTQDHITPLSRRGSHTLSNVIGACRSCNSEKGVKPPKIPVQPLLLTVALPKPVRRRGSVLTASQG
jgi:5-methylcytosine-specific restriction endonuclease McrA